MSDFVSIDEIESKLSLVIRKPQEGKTFICISSIVNDKNKNIHIVLTMNTLDAGMQFFGRLQNDIDPTRIVVFNSKKQTAGDCNHAKDVSSILDLINNKDIKVIVCCAHEKRIRDSLPQLFRLISQFNKFKEHNIKFVIHVDEAHAYMPANRKHIREFNDCHYVSAIKGYTATSDQIFVIKKSDKLFYRIHVVDTKDEFDIIRSPNYFGVKDCEFTIYNNLNHEILIEESAIDPIIPSDTFRYAGMQVNNISNWYNSNWYFDLGNELLLLSFVKHILPILNLPSDSFTYNFMPAYTRKATHYECMKLIIRQYPTSNVIVMNGEGLRLWRLTSSGSVDVLVDSKDIRENVEKIASVRERKNQEAALREPAYMIQQLIKDFPNCPTFVTGFTCVGMSVTLINQNIGNFDNVIMAHQHYSRDKLYQLCRFLFKYDSWSSENRAKIKRTHFHSLTETVRDECIQYEEHIETICTDFAGKTCTLNEINGGQADELSERERKMDAINSVTLINKGKLWKKFKVYDGNDDEQWQKALQFYEILLDKKCTGKSMPTKNEEGFYRSSDSHGLGVQAISTFTSLENEKWTNRFALRKDILSYARIFVGYDNLSDPTEYTIFIKYALLEDNDFNRSFLNEWEK